jgi:hypothetical protein
MAFAARRRTRAERSASIAAAQRASATGWVISRSGRLFLVELVPEGLESALDPRDAVLQILDLRARRRLEAVGDQVGEAVD